MTIKPIRTEADYQQALSEIKQLWDALAGSPEADRLDVLFTLVAAYEAEHHAIDLPDPLANNLGVKGVGEPPIIPTAAAVANAVADALGVRIKDLPITRQKILGALQGKQLRITDIGLGTEKK